MRQPHGTSKPDRHLSVWEAPSVNGWKYFPLRWRHNGRDSVSNHQPHDCLLNRLFRRRSKKLNHQSSASLAFVWGSHRGPVNSPHKRPVTRKMFPFDDVIIIMLNIICQWLSIMLKIIPWWSYKTYCRRTPTWKMAKRNIVYYVMGWVRSSWNRSL